MVRNYVRKRTKPEFNEEDMQAAIARVQNRELTLRKAAEVYGVTHTSLFYRLKKLGHNNDAPPQPREAFSTKYTFRQVFNQEQEELLASYILKCSRMNYGLTYALLRTLAYNYAKR